MIPTPAQQKAGAIAPIPFAALSLLSSGYVIHYLLRTERQRLERLYHRLVLAMNAAALLDASTYLWGPLAVPAETPNFYGASGNVQTCTANAFIFYLGHGAVPTYYASLSLQAFMGIRNNFHEEKYRWIEKYIHAFAWGFPLLMAIAVTSTENFNPSVIGCNVARAPPGCDSDPEVPCQRGVDFKYHLIVGAVVACLVMIVTPSILILMFCRMRNTKQNITGNMGMQQLRERARSHMLKNTATQMSVYLLSFWITWVPPFILFVFSPLIPGESVYNVIVSANCLLAFQGCVLAGVYFALPILAARERAMPSLDYRPKPRAERDVQDIRDATLAACIERAVFERPDMGLAGGKKVSFAFNIFDGTLGEDSPWAKFINEVSVPLLDALPN